MLQSGEHKNKGKNGTPKQKLLPRTAITVTAVGHQPVDLNSDAADLQERCSKAIDVIELACGNATVDIRSPERWSSPFRSSVMSVLVAADQKAQFVVHGHTTESAMEALAFSMRHAKGPEQEAKVYEVGVELAASLHPDAPLEAAVALHKLLKANGYQGRSLRHIKRDLAVFTRSNEAKQTAITLAKGYLQSLNCGDSNESKIPPLIYHQERYYVYVDGIYKQVSEAELRQKLMAWMQSVGCDVSSNCVRDVLINMQGLCGHAPWELDLPLELCAGDPSASQPSSMIIFGNGIGDPILAIAKNEEIQLQEFDRRYFSTAQLPFGFDPEAHCPLWQETISDIFPSLGDGDMRISVLQECFGYALIHWPFSLPKALVLVGNGSNGKSTVLEVLESLVGKQNVSHVGLDRFGNRFDIAAMSLKLLNVMRDMPRMSKAAEGVLKSLISNEPILAEEKFLPAFSLRFRGKLVFATNHLPGFTDLSDGLWRRLLIMPFYACFKGKTEDKSRVDRLQDELPGIFNWALRGARRLFAHRDFTHCSVCTTALESHRRDQDTVALFVAECCVRGVEEEVGRDALYAAYKGWCLHNGRHPCGGTNFAERVLALPGLANRRPGTKGSRPRCFSGIDLR